MSDITHILVQIDSGDLSATKELFPLVYDELRKLAAAKLAHEKPGLTLQATVLVHEAYLRLGGPFANSRHFFGAAAEAMRRILVESARRKARFKHGGGYQQFQIQEDDLVSLPPDERILALDEALSRLAMVHPHLAELVKLRYFAEMTIEQTAALLGNSPRTVKRNWVYASSWLKREMARADGVPDNQKNSE